MRKICVVTATRAEYGLLKPLMDLIQQSTDLELQVIVTGAHLSPEFGLTYLQIEADGFTINEKLRFYCPQIQRAVLLRQWGLL